MRMTTLELGGLTTRVVDDSEKPELAVILCHGFGASGEDLVPLGAEMLSRSEKLAAGARFYFPAAPLDLSEIGMWGSRAWWMIDIAALNAALAEGRLRERIRNDRPEGMLEARAAIRTLVDDVRQHTGLPLSRIALGGFSQGSMVTLDVALQLEENPACVIGWSGTILNEVEWRERGKMHQGMRVLQTHGRQDPLLPYNAAEAVRDLLLESGCEVEFVPFNGPHTIPQEGLTRAVALLEGAL